MKKLLPSILFFAFICALIILVDIKGTEYLLGWFPKIPYSDKLGHFGLYGILALLLNHALNFKTSNFFRFTYYHGSVIILSFAILEEFTQIFLDTRSFDFLDMAADVVGIWLFSQSWFRSIFTDFHFKISIVKRMKNK